MEMVLVLLLPILMGSALGLVLRKKRVEALESDLAQLKAQHLELVSDLELVRESESDLVMQLAQAMLTVVELESQLKSVLDSEMEKLPESE